MAARVFASLDLVRLIYSFGDPKHREFTKNLKWDLKPWPEVFIFRFTERRLISGFTSYSIQEYMNEYTTNKIHHMLSTYKRCYCCSRHNIDKPMLIQGVFCIPEPCVFESYPKDSDLDCTCTCRLLSRRCVNALQNRNVIYAYT
jgi:hypothetical protein